VAVPNSTFETAITISSLPFSLSTTANDSGVTYSLWYKYIPAATEYLSVFGFATGTGYEPRTRISMLVDGFPDDLPDDVYHPGGYNVPITFPVESGNTYFIEFDNFGDMAATADLTINIIKHTTVAYPDESLMIPDDTWGFGGAIMSPTTGEVLEEVHKFSAGEEGDSLSVVEGGQILTEDYNTDTLVLYDKQLNFITSVAISGLGLPMSGVSGVISDVSALHSSNPKFYVGMRGGGSTPASFTTVSKTGVIGTTKWILPIAGMTSLAVNMSETIAYITGQSSSLSTTIARWDLVNNVALSSLTAPTGLSLIYVMKNDNIVLTTNDAGTLTLREYDSSFNLLHTYPLGTGTASSMFAVRLKHAADNPISIWCWRWNNTDGTSTFIKLRLSDGVHVQEFTRTQFESGTYEGDVTATPTDRFGHSFSCPLFILYEGSSGSTPGTAFGLFKIVTNKRTDHDGISNVKIPDPTFKTGLIP
jgi:hypothetical protein